MNGNLEVPSFMQGEAYERQRQERIEREQRAIERAERQEQAAIKRAKVSKIKKVAKNIIVFIAGGFVTLATMFGMDASKGSLELYKELNANAPFYIVDSSVNGFVLYEPGSSTPYPTEAAISFWQNRMEELGLTDAEKAVAAHGLPGTYGKQVYDGDVSFVDRLIAAHDWHEVEHARKIVEQADQQGPTR